ncbi:hypothetical protein F5Y04DRAFT_128552 [Hypomontagnella monticulosa]|nr:hypothetical protein F5Y04DRAFT_128552 [Hypomontagnella monticulosa]
MDLIDWTNYADEWVPFTPTQRHDTYAFISPATADLSGKSALITGASQGIGKQTAIAFATAGCSRIAVASRSLDALSATAEEAKEAARKAGKPVPDVLPIRLDITSKDDVKAAANAVTAAFGDSLDILINNAAAIEPHAFVHESKTSDWLEVWDVNIKGTYLCCRHFLPSILKSSLKTIVNLTSGMSIILFAGNSAYNTTKMALCRFTENLNAEYASQGLVTIACEPGLARTELAGKMHPFLQTLPMDAAALAPETLLWLVKERREWLSGRMVSARWDMEELLTKKEEVTSKNLLKYRVAMG